MPLAKARDGVDPGVHSNRHRRGNISVGMIRRQCTTMSKIEPIRLKVRELAGLTRKRCPTYPVVHQWLGISMDEAVRIKPSRAAWQLNRFPLHREPHDPEGLPRLAEKPWLSDAAEERMHRLPLPQ